MVLFFVDLFLYFWKVFVLHSLEKLSYIFDTREWNEMSLKGCVVFGVDSGLLARTVLPCNSNMWWS